jgi:hypothetical protein
MTATFRVCVIASSVCATRTEATGNPDAASTRMTAATEIAADRVVLRSMMNLRRLRLKTGLLANSIAPAAPC